MLKSVLVLLVLGSLVNSQVTEDRVKEMIEEETKKLIDQIDYQEEFDKIKDEFLNFDKVWEATNIGMSPGTLIFLILLLIYLPTLIIVGLVVLCCWGCSCGCFAWKRDRRLQNQNGYPESIFVTATNGVQNDQPQTKRPAPAAPAPAQSPYQEKPSLMPIRSRFTRPVNRINPSSGASVPGPASPTGSATNYQEDSGQW